MAWCGHTAPPTGRLASLQAIGKQGDKSCGSKRRERGGESTDGQGGDEAEKIYHLVAKSVPYLPLPFGGARF